jgi:hypothetical protein
MPVTVSPYDAGGLGRRVEIQAADFSQKFGWAQVLLRPDSLFNNGE